MAKKGYGILKAKNIIILGKNHNVRWNFCPVDNL